MSDSTPRDDFEGLVSKKAAEEILRTAADLDSAGADMIELEELRIAAADAGISARAFELSVREHRRASAETREPSTPRRAGFSSLRIAGVGAVGAATVVTAISLVLGPAPGDIIQGAIAAGAGSIGAVIAYLRSRGGGRSPGTGSARTLEPAEASSHPLERLLAGSSESTEPSATDRPARRDSRWSPVATVSGT